MNFRQITPTATWRMDLGERVEWEKARHGDQSGDLQETWTKVVAVDQSEVEDGSSVSLSKLLWSSLAFPLSAFLSSIRSCIMLTPSVYPSVSLLD